MSIQKKRYQKVLESIPCYPHSTTTIELRDALIATDLLTSDINDKSQLRTVQRCINQIAIDYVSLDIIDDCRPFRYQFAEGHPHPVKVDSMSAIMSLQIIEKEIKSMLPPSLLPGVNAIFSSLKTDNKQTKLWRERFCYVQNTFPLIAPSVGRGFFKLIERAFLEKKDVTLTYKKRGAMEPSTYTVTPLGLFLNGNCFYLVALKPRSAEPHHIYALHRIHSLKLSFSSAQSIHTFNIKEYVELHARHFFGGEKQWIRLKIENLRGCHLIEETLLDTEQRIIINDGNYTTIEVEVRDSHSFEWWLMKHANIVEVLAPDKMRKRVIGLLHESMYNYGLNR